ncbi:LysR family transcriptional regulator, partial [Burkholderia pseudomallei]|nr:LysR family transcriptional regulator [Burkholderia pseudomallei]MBF3850954.1 LysR family transcriptional regulator [Burkholderia pseudomallei]
ALPERVAIDPAKGPRFNQSSLAIDAAIAGHGVALASDQLVARDIEAGRLRRLFDFALPLSVGYYIVRPSEPRRPGDIAQTEAWLIRQAQLDARRDGA